MHKKHIYSFLHGNVDVNRKSTTRPQSDWRSTWRLHKQLTSCSEQSSWCSAWHPHILSCLYPKQYGWHPHRHPACLYSGLSDSHTDNLPVYILSSLADVQHDTHLMTTHLSASEHMEESNHCDAKLTRTTVSSAHKHCTVWIIPLPLSFWVYTPKVGGGGEERTSSGTDWDSNPHQVAKTVPQIYTKCPKMRLKYMQSDGRWG